MGSQRKEAELTSSLKSVKMDKLGEGHKDFEVRVEDLIDDRKETIEKNSDIDNKILSLPDQLKFGLDYVFRLTDPVLPGEKVPSFVCKGLVGDKENMVDMKDYEGEFLVVVFYPKDFTEVGDKTLDFLADLIANKEFNLKVVAVSTDTVECHKAWADSRELGNPVTMVGDIKGEVARKFGVLDTTHHLAFSALFLVDRKGVVQAVKVSGMRGLGMGGLEEAMDLIRDSFAVDVED